MLKGLAFEFSIKKIFSTKSSHMCYVKTANFHKKLLKSNILPDLKTNQNRGVLCFLVATVLIFAIFTFCQQNWETYFFEIVLLFSNKTSNNLVMFSLLLSVIIPV